MGKPATAEPTEPLADPFYAYCFGAGTKGGML